MWNRALHVIYAPSPPPPPPPSQPPPPFPNPPPPPPNGQAHFITIALLKKTKQLSIYNLGIENREFVCCFYFRLLVKWS